MNATMEAPVSIEVVGHLKGTELINTVTALTKEFSESQNTTGASALIAETRIGAESWAQAYDIALQLLGQFADTFTKSEICRAFGVKDASADLYRHAGRFLAMCENDGTSRAAVVKAVNDCHRQAGTGVKDLASIMKVKSEAASKKGEKPALSMVLKASETLVKDAKAAIKRAANPKAELTTAEQVEKDFGKIADLFAAIDTVVKAGHVLTTDQSKQFTALKAAFTK